MANLAPTRPIDPRLRRLWAQALAAPRCMDPTWIHGDLHARNVLVRAGQITAIIDWGDLGQGDPAVDLAGLWSILDDRSSRQRCISALADTAMQARAMGWAFFLGLVLVDTGRVDHPEHAAMGEQIFRRLLEDL